MIHEVLMIEALSINNLLNIIWVRIEEYIVIIVHILLLEKLVNNVCKWNITKLCLALNLSSIYCHLFWEVFFQMNYDCLFHFKNWNRQSHNRKRVISKWSILAILTLNKTPKLSIQIHNQFIKISFQKIDPRSSCQYFLIITQFSLQILHKGFFDYQVNVLMKSVK